MELLSVSTVAYSFVSATPQTRSLLSLGLNLDENAWSQWKDDIFCLCTSRKVPSCCNCHTLKLLSFEQATKFFPSCENAMCITEKNWNIWLSFKEGMKHRHAFVHVNGDRLQELAGNVVMHPLVFRYPWNLGICSAYDVIELNPVWPELTCYQDFEVNALGLTDLCSPGVSKGGCPSIPYARTCM